MTTQLLIVKRSILVLDIFRKNLNTCKILLQLNFEIKPIRRRNMNWLDLANLFTRIGIS